MRVNLNDDIRDTFEALMNLKFPDKNSAIIPSLMMMVEKNVKTKITYRQALELFGEFLVEKYGNENK